MLNIRGGSIDLPSDSACAMLFFTIFEVPSLNKFSIYELGLVPVFIRNVGHAQYDSMNVATVLINRAGAIFTKYFNLLIEISSSTDRTTFWSYDCPSEDNTVKTTKTLHSFVVPSL